MTDWLPQVAKIEQVKNHPDADTLDVVTVLGDYPVIVKRGEYKVGNLAGYIPIDSIVPDTDQFYFLCPKSYIKHEDGTQTQAGPKYPQGSVPEKYRIIKAKRIRGTYSQGMLIQLPEPPPNQWPDSCHQVWRAGESIVELVGLTKWEEPEEENLPNMPKARGINAEKAPEGWKIPHYDIDGVRKYIACLQEGEEIVLTEKIHGSNAGFCHDGTRLWVKSRNFYKKEDEDDMWWDVALRNDLATKLAQFPTLVFFGEVYGQVKGFRYDSKIEEGRLLYEVRFFDIFDTKTGRYLDYDHFVDIIVAANLKRAPELYRGPWMGKEQMYPYAEGTSTLNPKHVREGWVLRTVKERYEPKIDSRMQVKLVGEGYNLQK
jgi:RNA ligase (TIGR02306 family)